MEVHWGIIQAKVSFESCSCHAQISSAPKECMFTPRSRSFTVSPQMQCSNSAKPNKQQEWFRNTHAAFTPSQRSACHLTFVKNYEWNANRWSRWLTKKYKINWCWTKQKLDRCVQCAANWRRMRLNAFWNSGSMQFSHLPQTRFTLCKLEKGEHVRYHKSLLKISIKAYQIVKKDDLKIFFWSLNLFELFLRLQGLKNKWVFFYVQGRC